MIPIIRADINSKPSIESVKKTIYDHNAETKVDLPEEVVYKVSDSNSSTSTLIFPAPAQPLKLDANIQKKLARTVLERLNWGAQYPGMSIRQALLSYCIDQIPEYFEEKSFHYNYTLISSILCPQRFFQKHCEKFSSVEGINAQIRLLLKQSDCLDMMVSEVCAAPNPQTYNPQISLKLIFKALKKMEIYLSEQGKKLLLMETYIKAEIDFCKRFQKTNEQRVKTLIELVRKNLNELPDFFPISESIKYLSTKLFQEIKKEFEKLCQMTISSDGAFYLKLEQFSQKFERNFGMLNFKLYKLMQLLLVPISIEDVNLTQQVQSAVKLVQESMPQYNIKHFVRRSFCVTYFTGNSESLGREASLKINLEMDDDALKLKEIYGGLLKGSAAHIRQIRTSLQTACIDSERTDNDWIYLIDALDEQKSPPSDKPLLLQKKRNQSGIKKKKRILKTQNL